MGSKNKNDALRAMEEYTEYRWELLRRNADYRSEYDRYFRKYLSKKEVERLEFPKDDGSLSVDEWNEKVEAWKRMHKELEPRMGVSYKDMERIQKIKQNPSDSFRSGNLYVVTFCGCWGLRYPKDYKENFDRKMDWNLFYDYGWINSAGWELPAYGISSHIDEISASQTLAYLDSIEELAHAHEQSLKSLAELGRNLYGKCFREGRKKEAAKIIATMTLAEKRLELARKNPSYSSAIADLRESLKVLLEDGERRRKNGEQLIVLNTNFSDDMIFAYISKLLESDRRKSKRKQLKLEKQWRLTFDIWDMRSEGMTFPQIQEMILGKIKGLDWEVSTISRRYKKIDKEIRKMSERNASRIKN